MTPNLRVINDYIKANYDLAIGVTNCRRISGSQTYSQHSWSNAVDLYTSSHALQDEIAANLALIYGTHIRNILTWRYNSAHWNHVHVDMWPMGWLTPPCAGGELRIKYRDGTVTNGPFPDSITEEDDMTPNEINAIALAVWGFPTQTAGVSAQLALTRCERGINTLLLEVDSDPQAIAQFIVAELGDDIAQKVADELAARLVF